MSLPASQRRVLGAFLRARREALPADTLGRRRTPGLRREEVAQRCGLSTTWYTWVEQGRDIALSAAALARLAGALRLTAPERAYLFEVTCRRDPARPTAIPALTPAPPELLAALRATQAPAYLLDPFWNARGYNDAAGRLLAPWFGSGEMCLLRYVFLDESAAHFIHDWHDRARRLLAEFRADTAPGWSEDHPLRALVHELQQKSAVFTKFWNDHAVLAREGGVRVFNHPVDGVLQYTQLTLLPAAYPGYKLVLLLSG